MNSVTPRAESLVVLVATWTSSRKNDHMFYGRGFQFKMTVMGAVAPSVTVATKNRWPSEDTMYW